LRHDPKNWKNTPFFLYPFRKQFIPDVVDELQPIARVLGVPKIERKNIFHAFNQKALARRIVRQNGKSDEEVNNYIVPHMGEGITVGHINRVE
jgi:butyrate kinase